MRRALALALVLFLASATPAEAFTWRNATVRLVPENVIRVLIAQEHLRVCNDALRNSIQLDWAARFKAMDMGFRNRFDHAFVDGAHIWDFYEEAGIDRSGGAGEIIAVNNFPNGDSPRKAFEGWMASQAHRDAIRNCDYDRFGVGAFKTKANGGEGKKWYVAEFVNSDTGTD